MKPTTIILTLLTTTFTSYAQAHAVHVAAREANANPNAAAAVEVEARQRFPELLCPDRATQDFCQGGGGVRCGCDRGGNRVCSGWDDRCGGCVCV